MRTTTIALLALCSSSLAGEGKEWAKGIPFTTDWKEAIQEARNTGKVLFIYNGWEGERI
jgi:hypothetical protein